MPLILYYLLSGELIHIQRPTSLMEILALLKKIFPDLPPCLSPTPKSFLILWTGTGQGFVKQILFYRLHTCFFIFRKCACEQRMDSELVVLFLALFQSLWKIWDRITKSSNCGFPPRPDVALDSQHRIQIKAANTKWSGLPWKLKLIFSAWDRLSLKALLALEFYSYM